MNKKHDSGDQGWQWVQYNPTKEEERKNSIWLAIIGFSFLGWVALSVFSPIHCVIAKYAWWVVTPIAVIDVLFVAGLIVLVWIIPDRGGFGNRAADSILGFCAVQMLMVFTLYVVFPLGIYAVRSLSSCGWQLW